MTVRPQVGDKVGWDEHLLLVLSVLVSVAFAQTFAIVSESGFDQPEMILAGLVFFVVLDNWYHLHVDLQSIDLPPGPAVILGILAVLAYSCLPFLFASGAPSTWELGPAEWMAINLGLICLFDGLWKATTLTKLRNQEETSMTPDERKVIGKYFFLAATDSLYVVLLCVVVLWLRDGAMSSVGEALAVTCVWLFVRGIDSLVVPRAAEWFFRFARADEV